MSSFKTTDPTRHSSDNKLHWEDPCLVLERSLVARAQGGGTTEEERALQQLLGPLNGSGTSGDCG